MDDGLFSSVQNDIKEFTECPRRFLCADEEHAKGLRRTSRDIFSLCVASLRPELRQKLAIQQLIIDGFNDEQIWQELELFNELSVPLLTADVSRLTAFQHRIKVSVVTDDSRSNHVEASQSPTDPLAAGGSGGGEHSSSDESRDSDEAGSGSDEGYSDSETSSGIGSSEPLAIAEEEEDDEELGSDGVPDQYDSDEAEQRHSKRHGPLHRSRSIVDDKFFNLSEMEQYLENEDRRFEREREGGRSGGVSEESDEDVDLFTEHSGQVASDRSNQRSRFMYLDFFDPPGDEQHAATTEKRKREKESDSSGENDEEEEDGGENEEEDEGENEEDEDSEQVTPAVKSNLDKRQDRLREYIGRLEEENLASQPWQLSGETTAAARPRHALVDQQLEFEQSRRAPIITADVTAALERIIRRRIVDAAWDDVQRQTKPSIDPHLFKQRLTLDQEKSKLSLAQLYEQEYQKQKESAEARPDDDMAVDVGHSDLPDPNTEQEQIKRQMSELFAKLDALTNFHFVPKKPSAEVKIVTKLPAISAEEILPVASSNMELLAPEEIKEKKRAPPMAKDERSSTDKKRERRKKKHRQSVRAAQRTEREGAASRALLAASGGAPEHVTSSLSRQVAQQQVEEAAKHGRVTKVSKKSDKKALKSSSSFFTQLQDQVTNEVGRAAGGKPRQKRAKITASSDFAKMRL